MKKIGVKEKLLARKSELPSLGGLFDDMELHAYC
jgi:hypothetical protein